MMLSFEAYFEQAISPSGRERVELESLKERCLRADGFEPGIRYDTDLNANKELTPWFFAKVKSGTGYERVIGAACIFAPTAGEGEISACVDPLYRGQGVFTELFRMAIDSLRLAGIPQGLLVADARLSYGGVVASKLGAAFSHAEALMELRLKDAAMRRGAVVPKDDEDKVLCLAPIGEGQIDAAAALSCRIFGDEEEDARSFIASCLEDPSREQYLAMAVDGPIGMAAVKDERDGNGATAMIHGLGVIPELRGKGYGGALLDTLLAGLRAGACSKAALEVDSANSTAVKLYESRGFLPVSHTGYWRFSLADFRR